ncbi:MAG: proteasome-activating nucleotidase [Candidatus Hermodarchaeia archaeon]|jgi:proteasome regulatory subunit
MTDSTDLRKKTVSTDDYMSLAERTVLLEQRVRELEAERDQITAERTRLENEVRILQAELNKLRQPPLVSATVIDVLDDGRVIVKSSTGPQFVVNYPESLIGSQLESGAKVALNQRTLAVVDILPISIDPFVQAMNVEESPDVTYEDIGGLAEQIAEIRETVELPLLHPELFEKVGIEPPKGVLLCGPPGTGKTLLARAVAHETKATFIRVIGSELVQKFIGEGARIVREIFYMARKRAPSIVFIDELDAVASRRLDIATSGDREVQRTLMQLLSMLDGFDPRGDVRILAATNRPDILDSALTRPGRFDRIIEFPFPDKEARVQILKIHMRNMSIHTDVDISILASKTNGSSGADLKAICTEAGMFAIRELRDVVCKEDFDKAITKVLGTIGDRGDATDIYG